MRKRSILLTLPALLAGCTTTSTGTASSLAETEWRFTTIDGAPPAGDATLAFRADRLVASAGCNRLGGTWREEAGKLVVGPLMSTRMFCAGKMEQERALNDLFGAMPLATVSGDRLTLKSEAHSAELARK